MYIDHFASSEEITVMVNFDDFISALTELKPSVTASDLEHYKRVQQKFNEK
jgi:peroxin-6